MIETHAPSHVCMCTKVETKNSILSLTLATLTMIIIRINKLIFFPFQIKHTHSAIHLPIHQPPFNSNHPSSHNAPRCMCHHPQGSPSSSSSQYSPSVNLFSHLNPTGPVPAIHNLNILSSSRRSIRIIRIIIIFVI